MSIREATEKERKEIISAGLDERHVKMLNYYDKEIYFLSSSQETDSALWVEYTGLTTDRLKRIVDELEERKIACNGLKILDIGCGHAEFGVEMLRRFEDVSYTGLDINENLLKINKLNLSSCEFKKIDLNDREKYDEVAGTYDIVSALGVANSHYKIFYFVSIELKPKYIICETHSGRMGDLNNIIAQSKGYKIESELRFRFDPLIKGLKGMRRAMDRTLYILEREYSPEEKWAEMHKKEN